MTDYILNWSSSPSLTSYETTDLNSLANAASVTGDAINNSDNLYTYMDIVLVLAAQGSARSSGAYVALYLIPAPDGTNYVDTTNLSNYLVGVIALDAATTARREALQMIPVPPGYFRVLVQNNTGQAWASSGNTLGYRLYTTQMNEVEPPPV